MNKSVSPRPWLVGVLLLIALAALDGCSGTTQSPTSDPGPLNELSAAYRQATAQLNRPPKSADELQPHLAQGKDVNNLLTSPNDGQPYVILWGTDIRTGMDLKPLVVGYEKQGTNGARFVFTVMGVMLMGPEEFKEANFPPGHTPQ